MWRRSHLASMVLVGRHLHAVSVRSSVAVSCTARLFVTSQSLQNDSAHKVQLSALQRARLLSKKQSLRRLQTHEDTFDFVSVGLLHKSFLASFEHRVVGTGVTHAQAQHRRAWEGLTHSGEVSAADLKNVSLTFTSDRKIEFATMDASTAKESAPRVEAGKTGIQNGSKNSATLHSKFTF
eukprot:Opistho-2@84210